MTSQLRVFVEVVPRTLSRGIHRVAAALATYAPPWAKLVGTSEVADLEVLHVIGHGSVSRSRPRDFAVVQYCLRTTEDPRPEAWLPIWAAAKLVWSYYDLPEYVRNFSGAPAEAFRSFETGREAPCPQAAPGSESVGTTDFNFYLAPLGVDGTVFLPRFGVSKHYLIGTSGHVAGTESVMECARAAREVGGRMFHLGPNLGFEEFVTRTEGCDDRQLSIYWSACTYVAGLRRIEGFELPALEGLACGARPVLFDNPCYTRWFGEHAVYIPEGSPAEVQEALRRVFTERCRAEVSKQECREAVQKFGWDTVARGFWERLEAAVR